MTVVALLLATVLCSIAVLHVYWAVLGVGAGSAVPSRADGTPLFRPGRVATLLVAAALLLASVIVLAKAHAIRIPLPVALTNVAMWAVAVAFTARTIGDFRYAGVFKRERGTAFARADTRLYTPLCAVISVGVFWVIFGSRGRPGEDESNAAPLTGAGHFAARTNADATPPPIPYDSATPRMIARAIGSWPHDTTAYTQGFAIDGDRVLEGTGLVGKSDVRVLDLRTGRALRRTTLPASLFGEGIAVVEKRLLQLTWTGGRGYVYDATSLALMDSVSYAGEGWGLTFDGQRLFLSDGTDQIRVIDPNTFVVERTFKVREAGNAVWMLNELECVDGELLANIYETDLIARIDVVSGNVVGWIDVSQLLTPTEKEAVSRRGGVANGIAYDAPGQRLLVTGKLWPRVFALSLPRTGTGAGEGTGTARK